MEQQQQERRRTARVVVLLTLLGLIGMHGLPDGMAVLAHHRAAVARVDARFAAPSSAAPMGCGLDHANCVAVLRDAGQLSAPSASSTPPDAALGLPGRSLVSVPARGSRAPPDVSLIDLGISRT